jgi:hypothetical protein
MTNQLKHRKVSWRLHLRLLGERLDDVAEHANDNESHSDKEQILMALKNISDAEEGLRILAQFSNLMEGNSIEPWATS